MLTTQPERMKVLLSNGVGALDQLPEFVVHVQHASREPIGEAGCETNHKIRRTVRGREGRLR